MAIILPLLAQLFAFLILARLAMRCLTGQWRDVAFAAVNLVFVYLLFFKGEEQSGFWPSTSRYTATFIAYLGMVTLQYGVLRAFSRRGGFLPWLAFFTPILSLLAVRFIVPAFNPGAWWPSAGEFIGISYLAFRCSHLAMEVRNEIVPIPGYFRYLGFAFFLPTLSVGPINPYSNHLKGFAPTKPEIPLGRAALRILVGVVHYKYLGSLFFQLTYTNLLFDDHFHHWIDLPIAAVFFYLFLYCNFSGFCDIAIGAAGLIGIPVAENFNNPFAARNIKEFWNRWHITLSLYVRDIVFSPLSKFLGRHISPIHATAIAAVIGFIVVGAWHGSGFNFFLFGASHGVALAANQYYTFGLKKWLGRDGFKAYNENRWIHAAAVTLTFCYVAATLFLFANSIPQMKQIFSILR